jgi:hypothetical protein
MTDVKNIQGQLYPAAHRGWGSFAEELFHYTSRYYCTTESFLRTLAHRDAFTMSGYKAARLSAAQREAMAAILACEPSEETAQAAIDVVEAVLRGESTVDDEIAQAYRVQFEHLSMPDAVEHHLSPAEPGVNELDPLDPFMSQAQRLLMPVAVRDHHVEVSMHELARHLDSPHPAIRTNLRNAIILLHNAGYVLRNHPDLTHAEADAINQVDDS